jgi:hypothetical protein
LRKQNQAAAWSHALYAAAFFAPVFLELPMPFGYADVAWAALTEIQRIAAVFAQLDSNLVFVGNATKAGLFLEAVQYLRYHRAQNSVQNSRTFSYADYADDVALANKTVSLSAAAANRSVFTELRPMT